jgi:hypothetical protein
VLTGKDRIQQAMTLQGPHEIPVMCQMSVGHILLNTGTDPLQYNFTNHGFAQALLEARQLYDFDGILIHKPGRQEDVLDLARQEETDEGIKLVFDDGGAILCPKDDDPRYIPPEGYGKQSIESFEFETYFDSLPPSLKHWLLTCGLWNHQSTADVPEEWYACIDLVLQAANGNYSIHGEVNSPFDAIFHLLSFEEVLTGLLTYPEKIHHLLEALTRISAIWAVAQVRRGCDAVKLSSPWAGSGFISRAHYREFVLRYERVIVEAVRVEGGVIYTHTCGSIGDRLDLMSESGVHGIECLDPPPLGNIDLKEAVSKWGEALFIKGNVDSVHTLLSKDAHSITSDALERLSIGAQARGFILSTACSIAPRVPVENVKLLVDAARSFKSPE